ENEGTAYIKVSAADDLGEKDTLSFIVTVNRIAELFYVDSSASGNDNGQSWADAFNYLQDALEYASEEDTIWIAAGTYYPDEGGGYQDNARDSSFVIPDSVQVFGGFAGTEEHLNERDLSLDHTILSGDIDQSNSIDNNSLHVVTFENVSSLTMLNGVTVTGGLADGSDPDNKGGGIFINGSGDGKRSNPRILNCIITGNKANKGGGVFNFGGSYEGETGKANPVFVNCVFKGNDAGEGGGVYNDGYNGECSPTLINCTFSGNSGTNSGALYNFGLSGTCAPSLINCNIWGNEDNQKQISNSNASVSYDHCNIESREAQGTNISSEPFFVNMPDYNNAPTTAGNLNIYSNSPCINSGNNTAVDTLVETDLLGSTRIQDGTVDIGAYEGGMAINAQRIYVDSSASGNNDGSSWTDAYTSLQDALDQVSFADSIWVAAGTYLPGKDKDGNSSPSDTRTKTFYIPDYISVCGGFDGTEDALSNADENETILSGDLGTVEDSSDNAYHVVYFEDVHEMTLLSGFTIKGGNADGSDQDGRGGGIYNVASDYGYESNPRIEHCTITENDAVNGAGIYNDGETGECKLQMNNCTIISNEATGNGGGIYNRDCNPELTNCIITENYASQEGGGVYNYAYSTASTINPVFTNCLIYANIAGDDGGAISNRGNGASNPSLINCTLAGNQATNNGGSIYNNFGAAGGPRIINSIIWDNNSDIYNGSNADPKISFSNIQNSGGSGGDWNEDFGDDYGNNIDENPRFIGASAYQTVPDSSGGYRLYDNSPCINAGANDSISELYDLERETRIQDGTVDMGVFEGGQAVSEKVIYVDSTATGSQDGTSWSDAYIDLNDALSSAKLGDTIWVAEGTYYPTADKAGNESPSDNRMKTFSIPDLISVYGGFEGNESLLEQRRPDTNRTILSGDLGTKNDDSDNAYHVVYFDHVGDETLLDGFDITAGKAGGSNSEGGGIFNDGSGSAASSPVVRDCRIIDNQADKGGGIYSHAGSYRNQLKLINCYIRGNSASKGGGFYSYARDNGIDSTVLMNCVFSGNSADYGGGIYTYADNGTCNPRLINCTLSGNNSSVSGGAMFNEESAPELINCILWNNSGDGVSMLNASPSYAYCNIEGSGGSSSWDTSYGVDNGNNMDEDPDFVMPVSYGDAPSTTGDFRLYEGSPCIDTADNAANTGEYDIVGNTRIQNSIIDMGAYEGAVSIPTAYYVDKDATGSNDGSSWDNAYNKLQDALSHPNKYKVPIWVAEGVYYPDEGAGQTNDDRNSTFDIPDSIKVYGGFSGVENSLNERDWENNETILSGDIGISDDKTDNAYHVVSFESVSEETVLDGFTIKEGNAGGGYGAGIYNLASESGNRSKPRIRNCIIENNTADGPGAGMYNKCEFDTDGCNPVLNNTTIINNEGGGIYNDANGGYEASPVLTNCVITGNNGVGINNYGNGGRTSPQLTNCIINGNNDDGVFNYSSNSGEASPVLVNSIISGNQGDGISNQGYSGEISPLLVNCTVTANGKHGMVNSNNGAQCIPVLTNTILWNNNAIVSGDEVKNTDASPSFTHCNIQGSGGSEAWNSDFGLDKGNNIDSIPVFIEVPDVSAVPTTGGDFHLFTASPCIDTG
ncbi:MAG: right-handed parallel beta-helix repeat-containing protein, partial [Bacteroidales bacterium]